jgi:multiple sugar transport system permease protein
MVVRRPARKGKWGPYLGLALKVALVLVGLVWTLFPMYWMLAGSVTHNYVIFNYDYRLWPQHPTFENYTFLFEPGSLPLGSYLRNSLITGVGTGLITTAVSLLAAYSLSRYRYRFKDTIQLGLLATQMFPLVVLLVPLYLVFARADLLNSNVGLVIAFCSFAVPVGVFFMKGFIDSIPMALDESAWIDGCTGLRTLWHIVLPLAWPGVIAVGIFAFLGAWNDLLFPLVMTSKDSARTLPPGLAVSIQQELRNDFGGMMAACVVAAVPPIAALIAVQRHIVGGLASGALKG